MVPSHPIIVVLVLTHNQKDKTIECLSSLLASPSIPFKVLVWDNGSRDGTLTVVQMAFPDVLTHYCETNLGVAEGRNTSAYMAINQFEATHLLFLDNDILVESDFIKALYEPFLVDKRIGQTQAKLRFRHDRRLINDGGGARISFVFWRVKPVGFGEPDRGQYDVPRPCISCGGAMMVRSDIFQQLDGFDPLFRAIRSRGLRFFSTSAKSWLQSNVYPEGHWVSSGKSYLRRGIQ